MGPMRKDVEAAFKILDFGYRNSIECHGLWMVLQAISKKAVSGKDTKRIYLIFVVTKGN